MRAFLTPAWLLRHAVLLVAVGVCAALGWWQFDRAMNGNTLSWAYAVEWPVFAVFAIGIWVREIRLTLRGGAPATAEDTDTPLAGPTDPLLISVPVRAREVPEPDQDGDLSAYNDYLAWLAEDPTRRPADYRR